MVTDPRGRKNLSKRASRETGTINVRVDEVIGASEGDEEIVEEDTESTEEVIAEESSEQPVPEIGKSQVVEELPFIQKSPFMTVLSRIPNGGFFMIGDDVHQVIKVGLRIEVAKLKVIPGGFEEIARFMSGPEAKCRAINVVIKGK